MAVNVLSLSSKMLTIHHTASSTHSGTLNKIYEVLLHTDKFFVQFIIAIFQHLYLKMCDLKSHKSGS